MTKSVNVKQALEMIESGEGVLVDVREADEFKAEHVAYALSVPLSGLKDGMKILNLPKDKKILFQCLKGARGQKACEAIAEFEGCDNEVVNVEGGINAWKEAGLPVISSSNAAQDAPKMPIFRQVQIIIGFLVLACVIFGYMGVGAAYALAGVLGLALGLAGLTGWCGLAMMLQKMPWNK